MTSSSASSRPATVASGSGRTAAGSPSADFDRWGMSSIRLRGLGGLEERPGNLLPRDEDVKIHVALDQQARQQALDQPDAGGAVEAFDQQVLTVDDIVAAIEAGDVKLAEKLMLAHLAHVEQGIQPPAEEAAEVDFETVFRVAQPQPQPQPRVAKAVRKRAR